MNYLEITVDYQNENVKTEGMIHSTKGNVDGYVNFQESGISKEMDQDEIIEYFEDQYSEDYNLIVEFETYTS